MTKNNPIMTKRYDLLDAYRLFASIGVIIFIVDINLYNSNGSK